MPAFTDWLRRKFFARLLASYPEEFRAEYGAEMQLVFDDRQRVEPLHRLLWDVVQDTVRTAPKEHFAIMLQDLRYALRQLIAQPGFTAVAVLSLALGIGANSAMFSLADALLLRPVPVAEPDELLHIKGGKQGKQFPLAVSHPDYLEIRAKTKSFTGVMAVDQTMFGFAARSGDLPQVHLGAYVSANFLEVCGIRPQFGRDFRADEDAAPGRDPVVLLSHDAWTNLFGASPSAIGRKIFLNRQELTVVGVLPAAFTGLQPFIRPAFYVPLAMSTAMSANRERIILDRRDNASLALRGRLRPGVSLAAAQAEAAALGRHLAQAFPGTNQGLELNVHTEFQYRAIQSPPDVLLISMLMGTVALVLLIACANVANLLLARGRSRSREVAVRLAIGANRSRLFRQLFTESLVLALLGCAAGLAFGYAGIRFFAGMPFSADVPLYFEPALDRRALLFSLAVSLASAIIFGVVPALRSLGPDLVGALKAGELDGQERRSRWFGRHALVVAQLAISCVLLVAAAMMVAGISGNLLRDPGFRRDNILMATMAPSVAGYDQPKSQRFYENLLARLRQTSGVRLAALASVTPTANDGQDYANLVPEGYQLRPGERNVSVYSTTVSDSYFDLFDIPILRGRAFASTDTRDKPPVAIVNDVFAERIWPGQNAVGRRFQDEAGIHFEVVGVAKRSRYLFISEGPLPAVYFAAAQSTNTRYKVLLRTDGDPQQAATPLREAVLALDANLPVQSIRTMADFHAKRTTGVVTMLVGTVASLGLLGLALAVIGLYGVMAYSVNRRTREIGIRMAIGADHGRILGLVMRQGGRIAAIGTAAGLALSFAAARVLEGGFVGLAVAHPLVFVIVPVLLMSVALLSCFVPARRAARVEPVRALRCE